MRFFENDGRGRRAEKATLAWAVLPLPTVLPSMEPNEANGIAQMYSGSCFSFYVDPGSGTLLWQLLAAFFFGAAFYVRSFASRILGFRVKSSEEREPKGEEKYTDEERSR